MSVIAPVEGERHRLVRVRVLGVDGLLGLRDLWANVIKLFLLRSNKLECFTNSTLVTIKIGARACIIKLFTAVINFVPW